MKTLWYTDLCFQSVSVKTTGIVRPSVSSQLWLSSPGVSSRFHNEMNEQRAHARAHARPASQDTPQPINELLLERD